MAKVLVCGSRSIQDRFVVTQAMHSAPLSYDLIIHGGAPGVDSLADWIAKHSNIPVHVERPDYQAYPPKVAPLKRNEVMVDMADAVIAIWDGKSRGTEYTIEYAKKQGKPVYPHIIESESRTEGEV